MKILIFTCFIGFALSCKMTPIPKVVLRSVDCENICIILDSVYEQDQKIRKEETDFYEFVKKDHENLERVVSIIENCKFPSLNEVSQNQMDAIWLSLHHAPDKQYVKKYFPLLENAKNNGDISGEAFATIQDRILMDDGEPQLYGTQIEDGKLYDLYEPEFVNQRRKILSMEPIEEYLKFYYIEFSIPQKTK